MAALGQALAANLTFQDLNIGNNSVLLSTRTHPVKITYHL